MIDDPPASPRPADRIRARARAAGLALAISALAPTETWHDGPRFVWHLAPDLRPATLFVILSPALCGALIALGSSAIKRATSLAVAVIAAIAGLYLVSRIGAEALAWDMIPPAEPWSSGPFAGLCAVACTVAGICLFPSPAHRRAGRAIFLAAIPCSIAHLFVPAVGEAPALLAARVIAIIATRSGPGNLISATLLSLVLIWPGVAALVGFRVARRLAQQGRLPSFAAMIAAYGWPIVVLPIVTRMMLSPWGSIGGAAALGHVIALAAMLLALASAILFLGEQSADLLARPRWIDVRPEGRAVIASLAVILAAAIGIARFSSPSGDAATSRLGPTTPDGDRLFADLLPAWNDIRSGEDLDDPRRPSGDIAAAEAPLRSAAQSLDPALGNAITALMAETAQQDLSERHWYTLVQHVNDAIRGAALPYYVDPTEAVASFGDHPRRWFRLDTYRIEAVKRFTAAGRGFAAMHVRAMVPGRTRLGAMGISRDLQPFALIVLDEIDAYGEDLRRLAARTPPRCGEGAAESAAVEEALQHCGDVLLDLTHQGDVGAALLDITERHEIQHQIDGPRLPRSGWLTRMLARDPPEIRDKIARELSAYLAQVTASGVAPRLTLVRLFRMALLARRGADGQAAILALSALGDGARIDPRGDGIARAYQALGPLGDDALRDRARRAWREVFGGDLASPAPG